MELFQQTQNFYLDSKKESEFVMNFEIHKKIINFLDSEQKILLIGPDNFHTPLYDGHINLFLYNLKLFLTLGSIHKDHLLSKDLLFFSYKRYLEKNEENVYIHESSSSSRFLDWVFTNFCKYTYNDLDIKIKTKSERIKSLILLNLQKYQEYSGRGSSDISKRNSLTNINNNYLDKISFISYDRKKCIFYPEKYYNEYENKQELKDFFSPFNIYKYVISKNTATPLASANELFHQYSIRKKNLTHILPIFYIDNFNETTIPFLRDLNNKIHGDKSLPNSINYFSNKKILIITKQERDFARAKEVLLNYAPTRTFTNALRINYSIKQIIPSDIVEKEIIDTFLTCNYTKELLLNVNLIFLFFYSNRKQINLTERNFFHIKKEIFKCLNSIYYFSLYEKIFKLEKTREDILTEYQELLTNKIIPNAERLFSYCSEDIKRLILEKINYLQNFLHSNFSCPQTILEIFNKNITKIYIDSLFLNEPELIDKNVKKITKKEFYKLGKDIVYIMGFQRDFFYYLNKENSFILPSIYNIAYHCLVSKEEHFFLKIQEIQEDSTEHLYFYPEAQELDTHTFSIIDENNKTIDPNQYVQATLCFKTNLPTDYEVEPLQHFIEQGISDFYTLEFNNELSATFEHLISENKNKNISIKNKIKDFFTEHKNFKNQIYISFFQQKVTRATYNNWVNGKNLPKNKEHFIILFHNTKINATDLINPYDIEQLWKLIEINNNQAISTGKDNLQKIRNEILNNCHLYKDELIKNLKKYTIHYKD